MIYSVLLTLDLVTGAVPSADNYRRTLFYNELEKAGFIRYKKVTTTWFRAYELQLGGINAVNILVVNSINKAKLACKVLEVDYVFSVSASVPFEGFL